MRMAMMTALILAVSTPLTAQGARTFSLAPGDARIYNPVGRVTLKQGTSGVVVEASPGGADAARLKLEAGSLDGHPTFRVIYPDYRIVYPGLGRGSSSQFQVRDDWTWGDDSHGDNRSVTVHGEGSGTEAWVDLVISVPKGARVGVYLGVGRGEANELDGDVHLAAASADLRLHALKGALDIETGSGNVETTDTEGELKIDTGSGDVLVRHHRGGRLKLDTGSGDVTGGELATDALEVETGSGEINLETVAAAKSSYEAGSGDITVSLSSAPSSLKIDTGSGDVKLTLPANADGEIDLESSSGELNVDFPIQLTRKEEGRLLARLGNGPGRISVETGSGDITVRH